MKLSVIGAGLRTPLLVHGLTHSGLPIDQVSLYDVDTEQAQLMARLAVEFGRGYPVRVNAAAQLEDAISGSHFVINSIRVGGMKARADDERSALNLGFAGQETTGPCGLAMALRTIPVALEQAKLVERLAPQAWIINFTNPAGVITQAISSYTSVRVVGICDTPAELFHRVAHALGVPGETVECDYFGLNHLGWIRTVKVLQKDVTTRLLNQADLIAQLYPSALFDAELLRTLRLIPSEYLYFYYCGRQARANQLRLGATRGEELVTLNHAIHAALAQAVRQGDFPAARALYTGYINRRNASYMKLEGEGGSALDTVDPLWNPFEGATGYHRIAVEAISALSGTTPRRMVLNVPNGDSIPDLAPEDVIECICDVTRDGPVARTVGPLPESVRALVISVKTYERLTIHAAVEKSRELAVQALFMNPIVGDWEQATHLVDAFAGR